MNRQFRILGVSGHREYRSQSAMRKMAEKCVTIAKSKKYLAISCGGCYYSNYKERKKGGWDYFIMLYAWKYDMPLILHLPFKSAYISKTFLSHASRTSGIVTYYREKCTEPWHYADSLLKRNQRIVDDAFRMAVFWDGRKKGGTYDTVKRAKKKGIPIDNYAAEVEDPTTLHHFLAKYNQVRNTNISMNLPFSYEKYGER